MKVGATGDPKQRSMHAAKRDGHRSTRRRVGQAPLLLRRQSLRECVKECLNDPAVIPGRREDPERRTCRIERTSEARWHAPKRSFHLGPALLAMQPGDDFPEARALDLPWSSPCQAGVRDVPFGKTRAQRTAHEGRPGAFCQAAAGLRAGFPDVVTTQNCSP